MGLVAAVSARRSALNPSRSSFNFWIIADGELTHDDPLTLEDVRYSSLFLHPDLIKPPYMRQLQSRAWRRGANRERTFLLPILDRMQRDQWRVVHNSNEQPYMSPVSAEKLPCTQTCTVRTIGAPRDADNLLIARRVAFDIHLPYFCTLHLPQAQLIFSIYVRCHSE